MPKLARTERHRLADLLTAAGPDAPTLCTGWTTRDLAAHLVLRERRPDAAAGIQLRALAGWTARVQGRYAARPYQELVRTFRGGPPTLSPFALPGADEAANTVEYFVHAEDVRRAGAGAGEPQEISAELSAALWRRLPMVARLEAGRRSPVRLVLARSGAAGGRIEVGPAGGERVEVTGEPGELVLFAGGRGARSRVAVDGSPAAVEALAGALPLPGERA
ncbi:TIGR03085 family metal-binding protein [Kitasatospora sp. NBC_00315]|uniref:TIGR03085 family metal-binding protein n=1 Tax=Kitasatospora sp. NBC_00315 TaxID=2975963 RepID=UPI003247617A